MHRYREIARDLTIRIADGDFDATGMLPAEAQLAASFGVSRGTVRNALVLMARQGAIAPRRGSGWLVRTTALSQRFSEVRSFAQWARSRGMEPGGQVVAQQRRSATPTELRTLRGHGGGPSGPTQVLEVVRLRTLNGRTVMLERTAYPPWIAPLIEALPADEPSVVGALEAQHGVRMVHGEHSIDAIAAPSEDARLLEVRRSSPLLRVRRVSYAADGRAIETGDDRYLPDAMSFQVQASLQGTSLTRRTG
ncbi:GntR family transcriptional regulator [Microbacterium hydrocarbonoxydans]|uniref:GntR family transcriptional regulator n=1 Tax=Microbacterium hydrocarbonoxydans TaxID=273678 RepID=UPI00203C3E04|nr:GntR family transcriptional regulator [Microbacterium hydrocarbonoxydans]MCM3779814.1 GntR family transcriptional regulator [Microbacterium hydrocarbonoxydans]